MISWKKLLPVILIIILIFNGWNYSPPQPRIDILHYDLNFDLYPQENFLKGDASIKGIQIDKSLHEIVLNFYDNMKIKDLTLNGIKTEYSRLNNLLHIQKKVDSDTFDLRVLYEGTPEHVGLSGFVFGEINKSDVVYNLSEPDYASSWFPCNDIPSDKALLDISITNDSSKVSVSNGLLKDVKFNGARKTYHWNTQYPIAPYLICIYSADYVSFSDKYISQDKLDTLPIQYYVFANQLENAKIDFADHPEFLDFFAKTFGEYPFIKEKYGVAEFLWQFGAMEHQTITGIGSNFVTGKKYFNDVYIHELAHHWFGDAVSPASWKDIWLNEGFATYSEALYAEHIGGKKALQSVMLSKFKEFKGTLYNPKDNLFGSTVYDKGCWVLHMLRKETGDSLFFKILRTYFEIYKYKNASTDDFKRICELISGRDFTKFFDQWLYTGIGKIELQYDWTVQQNSGDFIIDISVRQIQKEYDNYNFPLEFKFTTPSDSNLIRTFFIDRRQKNIKIILKDMPSDIEPDPSNWLLADIKRMKN